MAPANRAIAVHPLLTEPLWGKPSSSSVSDPAALIAVLIRTEAALRKLATATEKGTEDVDVLGEKGEKSCGSVLML